MNPFERLRYHVTGAIERGEGKAIVSIPAKYKIYDWAGNLIVLKGKVNRFDSFEEAHEEIDALVERLYPSATEEQLEIERGEYHVEACT